MNVRCPAILRMLKPARWYPLLVPAALLLCVCTFRGGGTQSVLVGIGAAAAKWHEPAEPVTIAGPLHFVGTRGLSVWLIESADGLILMNTGMPGSGPLTEASIRKLGFDPRDIRLLLACHAHVDHVGALAHFQRLSGAPVAILDVEAPLLASGGTADFMYGKVPSFRFEGVKADRLLRDGETIRHGGVALTALRTPGHTRGATTWTMTVKEGGKSYLVVFPDGTGVNPGYRVAANPSYPGIADDYRRTFQVLAGLKPDIWLAPHTGFFGFEGKRAKAARDGTAAWVDPAGYARWIERQRRRFESSTRSRTGPPAKGG